MSNPIEAVTAEKPKFKVRRRHLKKAFTVGLYGFVAVATIASMVAPIFSR